MSKEHPNAIDTKYHIEDNRIIKTGNGQAIPLHEPTFLFRGRDRLALPALISYRQCCEEDGATEFHMKGLDEMIARFRKFAENFPAEMKQPGSTLGK